MSRELKFRAWDVRNRIMDYDPGYDADWERFSINSALEGNADFIFMQYTGLKDGEVQYIYEGDIVELTLDVDRGGLDDRYYSVENAAVVWNSEDGCWDVGNSRLATYVDDEDWEHRSKVIGNIYEDGNLLK